MLYGIIQSWDPRQHEGLISRADTKQLVPFSSDRDWKKGDMVSFEIAAVAVHVLPKIGTCSTGNV
jgi:hypothetical protein